MNPWLIPALIGVGFASLLYLFVRVGDLIETNEAMRKRLIELDVLVTRKLDAIDFASVVVAPKNAARPVIVPAPKPFEPESKYSPDWPGIARRIRYYHDHDGDAEAVCN